MSVMPHRSRVAQKVVPRSMRGRWENATAHARQWETIRDRRLYQLMKTRPKEYMEAEKRELRHRHRYGETRGETYRKLNEPFQKGKLGKRQFKKFKHALNIGESWSDYEGFKEYTEKGLANVSEKTFKKAKKFIDVDFGVPGFRAYKKLKKKGLGSLTEQELRAVNRMRGVKIQEETHLKRRKLFLAKRRGLISERNGQLHIDKKLEDLDRGEVQLLKELGFSLPQYDDLQDVLEYR